MTDQELMHFGIPGMKWGVRRPSNRLDRQVAKNIRVSEARTKRLADSTVGKNPRTRVGQRILARREAEVKYQQHINAKLRERNPNAVKYNEGPERQARRAAGKEIVKGVLRDVAIGAVNNAAGAALRKYNIGGDRALNVAAGAASVGNLVYSYKKYKKAKYGV